MRMMMNNDDDYDHNDNANHYDADGSTQTVI